MMLGLLKPWLVLVSASAVPGTRATAEAINSIRQKFVVRTALSPHEDFRPSSQAEEALDLPVIL